MLNINKSIEETRMDIALEGRLDTTTSPKLEEEIKADIAGIKELNFDLSSLAYISSAGLRVLLAAQKIMNEQGAMTVKNVSDEIMEIFDMTGFSEILTIVQPEAEAAAE
ncbi:MAG: STAS domain-containing protein [Lachnospiraceae bacterium]|nr:STAS domain-containing protein [Lachnospiraceae bacterium]